MLPVLITLGPISISSLGFFLVLGFLLGTFLIWRLARAWEVNSEVLLDAVFFTTIFAFLGARIYFVLVNLVFFTQNIPAVLNIFRFPGFSFWGALIGGLIGLYICTKYPRVANRLSFGVLFASINESKKLNFYQIADIGAIGFLGGLILGNFGCLFAGCDFGIPSNQFFAVDIVGAVGRRVPVQFFEAILLLILLHKIWPQATKFHFHGKIVSKILIYIGLIKFMMQFWRDPQSEFGRSPWVGFGFSLLIFLLGTFLYYKAGKGSLRKDFRTFLTNLIGFFTNQKVRKEVVEGIGKSWYNKKVSLSWKLRFIKKLLRRARVKPTPENFQQN